MKAEMSVEPPEPSTKEPAGSISRRDFLKKTGLVTAGVLLPAVALELIFASKGATSAQAFGEATPAQTVPHWQFLVDTNKCVGCGLCVKACKLENEVPYNANASRTWVERHVVTKDGVSHVDSPQSARDGFLTPEIDVGEGNTLQIDPKDITKSFFVPKLCNQCNHPPCVQVCPVGATYKSPDGVVLVDRTWCIGCGYCISACPYGARFFHPVYHTAEKCTFCEHRISKGLPSACVQACPFGARKMGNQNDPADPVVEVIATQRVEVLKAEYGTSPQCFYLGLDAEVR
jgi:Fe-S-cluster-containing dehydrogenase component